MKATAAAKRRRSSGGERELAVFDVCDTLFHENTTIGFLRFVHGNSAAYARREWLAVSRLSPAFYAAALSQRLFDWDVARLWLVRSLRGTSRKMLRTAAKDYADHLMSEKRNSPLLDRLEEHRRRSDRIVLVSSSLDIVVAAIAEHLSVEYRASTLGFDDDRCTGRIDRDLTGNKEAAVEALGQRGLLHVYTDNRSDLGMIRIADRATIVVPRGRSSRWAEGQDYDLIRL